MANFGEKAISNLAGNLNSGRSYLITAVHKDPGFQLLGSDQNPIFFPILRDETIMIHFSPV